MELIVSSDLESCKKEDPKKVVINMLQCIMVLISCNERAQP
jgi:hypothetical protein